MLFPLYSECGKEKAVKLLNHFFSTAMPTVRLGMRKAESRRASGTGSAVKKKNCDFCFSYHHWQSQWKDSCTYALFNLRQDISALHQSADIAAPLRGQSLELRTS